MHLIVSIKSINLRYYHKCLDYLQLSTKPSVAIFYEVSVTFYFASN